MTSRSHIRTFGAFALVAGTASFFLLERSGDAALPSTFEDVSAARGIDVNTVSGGQLDWGSGVAFFDYDNDGDMDIYVAMGHGEANRLYQSDNAVTFTDRAVVAGCADPGNGKGVKLADYDNDGDQDIFIANMGGSNRLYENDGTGAYTDVTSAAGLVYSGQSHGASWGDYDNDGFLDLYVCVRALVSNLLYHNNRDGTFTNVAASAGVENTDRMSFESVWFDYDNDGDQDLYIAVDKVKGNKLYRNLGDGTFEDVSTASGAEVFLNGMGIAVGDYDNDGFEDLYITNTEEGHVLLHNNGNGTFSDETSSRGVAGNRIGWGTEFFDYDNDGDLDLYVVHWATGGGTAARNSLFRNDGAVFTDVAQAEGVLDDRPGYALATGDYNNDGFVDLFVHNRDAPSALYENTPNGKNWLKVQTVGKLSNRDGVGARVTVVTGLLSQMRDIRAGSSYLSQSSIEAEFGLGNAAIADVVEVRWPSGVVDHFDNVSANQTLTVREGEQFYTPGQFMKLSATSGIDITINGTNREDWGYGVAFFDYDDDGDMDLYVAAQDATPNFLFEQDRPGHFINVAADAVVGDLRNGRGVKVADYDNDGDSDFFLANYAGPNRLYRNNGDGTFTNVAEGEMVLTRWTFGATWGDYDADGWLDLYVVNRRQANQFFHNQGDGTFVEKAAALGIADDKAGLEAVWLDYDNDGDVDLYLSNDKLSGNRLWRNEGNGTFADVSVESGANAAINSMGIAVGDYDGNGHLDIYLTNTATCGLCSDIGNILYRNNGDGTFDNVADQLGVEVDKYGWGTAFFDQDNDGDLDLYVVNWTGAAGFPDDPVARTAATNTLFRNNGDGTFFDATSAARAGDWGPGYGVAVADYNDDGYLDMFITNNKWPSVFYENVPGNNRWLKVKTIGVESNRDGIGARVRVITGGSSQIREVRGGSSYLSHNSTEVEFGLAGNVTIDAVEVTWPSGVFDRWENVATNQTFTAREGATALVVTILDARAVNGSVQLNWETNHSMGVIGFRVYRTEAGSAEELLNPDTLIEGAFSYRDDTVTPARSYGYVVAAVEDDMTETRSSAATVDTPAGALALDQNYPNPFNPSTTIKFNLPSGSTVSLAVYDGKGRLVRVLASGEYDAGPHEIVWDGTNAGGRVVASGMYFYRLETSSEILTRKMTLLK